MAKGRILEIGVGTGKNFPHYPEGSHVVGIDIADRMAAIARRRAAALGLSFDIGEGDVQNLDFPDDSFDTAVATFVFCSVPDPVRGLNELRRIVGRTAGSSCWNMSGSTGRRPAATFSYSPAKSVS